MHDIADVERKDPIVCRIVFYTKSTSRCNLEFLLDLELVHLFKGLKRNFQFLFFSHAILEVVPSISKVKIANLKEFFLYLN